ncbi:MAG: hypothetical protein HUU32_06420 [Calditrichaceae bacterium]|nr:hypothetical protein [Calditrichia bacterium]NUQ41013.1 hypothetical protein [Calditrichaceae bacterium]
MAQYRRRIWYVALLCATALLLLACTSGIEDSPGAGIVRVILQSDPADTSIIILGDTVAVVEGSDYFTSTVFQGRVYRDSLFALLYTTLNSFRQTDDSYNLLERRNGQYLPIQLFETYVPPQQYNRLEFGLTGNFVRIGGPTGYVIPVLLPPGEPILISLDIEFEVFENQVTEVVLQIKPLSSLVRYRDTYYFSRQIEILSVQQK